MTIIISGPGIGLPPPQNLYPTALNNAPYDVSSNYVALAAGEFIAIPAGRWYVDPGSVSIIQFLDPENGVWRTMPGSAQRGQPQQILSDGFTRRIANLTGCPVAAIVAGGGTNFSQSNAIVSANIAGSTWLPIVGGSLSVASIVAAGAGYTVAPQVYISPPPTTPGVQATAYATIASGTVSGVTLTNFGAGYTSATVAALILPSPLDTNIANITQASVRIILNAANASVITAVLPTNFGTPIPSASLSSLTLTASGGSGSGATITPVILQTVTAATTTGGGSMGTVAAPARIITVGGVPTSTSAIVNPGIELTSFRPRHADINVTTNASGVISAPVISDGGLFAAVPSAAVIVGSTAATYTAATVTLTTGPATDLVLIQPV